MNRFSKTERVLWPILLGAAALFCGNCSKSAPGLRSGSSPVVEVVTVEQQNVPIYREWIGTLDGMVNAEIRAEVSGYLIRRTYEEGSPVAKGQLLFLIEPKPFQAALNLATAGLARAEAQFSQANAQLVQAQAQLQQVRANQGKTQLDVDRYTPLAKEGAVTRQDLDNAIQFNLAAKAQVDAAAAEVEASKAAVSATRAAVDAAKAEVETAKINFDYTRIVAPISGIAGTAQAQVGDLVGPGSGVLMTVSTVDPMRAYFTVSEQEYLELARNQSAEFMQTNPKHIRLELVLANGNVYPHKGKFYFTSRQVDPRTGAILMAGIFPNPGSVLRPGLFARIRSTQSTKQGALLVPQRSVSELQSTYQIAVVGTDDRITIRSVEVGDRVGTQWIIEKGLKPGERVVVEGVQKVHEGMVVTPKPFAP
jgi:membrane fusion protein (multidrug efflux system)